MSLEIGPRNPTPIRRWPRGQGNARDVTLSRGQDRPSSSGPIPQPKPEIPFL